MNFVDSTKELHDNNEKLHRLEDLKMADMDKEVELNEVIATTINSIIGIRRIL